MKITDISLQSNNKNRCNLLVDGKFFCGLSLETVMKYRLKGGLDVDKKFLDGVVLESEKSDALSKAIAYLSKRLKTKREVKDYLLKKGYTEEIVWFCIDKLKDYKYVDDEFYSKQYISTSSKNQGKRLIEYKLMMKGVKKEDISSAYEQVEIDSKMSAKSVAEKYLKNKENTKENKIKAYRYLISRCFSYEDANFALGEFCEDD